MNVLRICLVAMLALACNACMTLTPGQRARAEAVTGAARSIVATCTQPDACAQPSSLHALATRAFAESTATAPRHYALMLDRGADAMLARISLIRSARTSVDVQTYIFEEDDAGHLMLEELLAAARRGVRVRLLIDQLSALKRVDTLAALAGAHANFAIRVYNPVLGRAHISYPQFVLAAACCWHQLNQRMHTKLLLVDGAVGVTGGRNYADDYYDWDADYNFRDRDVLVAGPVARDMADNFDAFWASEHSWPAENLADVGHLILDSGVPPLTPPVYEHPERIAAMTRDAADAAVVQARLTDRALPVGAVDYLADLPRKHNEQPPGVAPASQASHGLRGIVESAKDEVLLQTPYLVLSDAAQDMFRAMHKRQAPPRVVVSTSSLASTDSFITYALSYKYKRRYLRDFGFEVHEYKPFPGDSPVEVPAPQPAAETAAPPGGVTAGAPPARVEPGATQHGDARLHRDGSVSGGYRNPLQSEYSALAVRQRNLERVPLSHSGMRTGLHAKSLVVDGRIAVIGTHNFDPRGDRYNTESAVVIPDVAFARELADSIRRDIAPANSWTIAPRDKAPVFSGLEYSLAKMSERMPIFDLWPVRYATSYDFVPGPACPRPLPLADPAFHDCYRAVGDFPEVNLGFKSVLTRIFTAFGAGLAPVL